MEDLLMVRTFGIVGCMLIISTITARLNKTYETFTEKLLTILGAFASIIMVRVFGDIYPNNIIACVFLSGFVGWSLGPTIGYIGQKFKWNKFLKDKGVKRKDINNKSGFWGTNDNKHYVYYYEGDDENYFELKSDKMRELEDDFNENVLSVDGDPYNQAWQNVVFQAMLSTCIAVFTTMLVVYISPYNFNFLGLILFISLIALLIMRILNAYIFKSAKQMLYQSYAGIVIFTLYLVYDFDRLKQANIAGDNSWGTAIDIAVNIYLDIINLFIELLIAMSENQ
jgi:FtsH-binding integral membrane protein